MHGVSGGCPCQSLDVGHMTTGNGKDLAGSATLTAAVLGRLKSDTHLLILSVFSIVASLAIAPFGVYRLVQGEITVALIDGLLVAAMLGNLVYAWTTGRTVLAGNLIATLLAAGALVMILGLEMSYLWSFSLMIGIFLMASASVSVALSLLVIVAVGSSPEMFRHRIEQLTFFAVALQVAVFSLGFAWQTARQHRQLDVIANRDPLTGVGNRRALRGEIDARVQAARTGGEPAALAILDLDHFKKVNDRHGHDAGDKVLVDLARIVVSSMRACDSFYRYGGEEFVLVMPDTPPEGIAPALEKLQEAIHVRLRAPDGPVTVSIGAAGFNADDDPGQWLSRADRALYEAKSTGRDRLCIDHDQGPPAGLALKNT
jgi:diguanylate cyclase